MPMTVLATYNIKGGVGKTSAAVNLAWLAAASGSRTLVCDLDPQGAATWCFRIRMKVRGGGKKLVRGRRPLARFVRETDHEGLDLLPADFSYRHLDLLLDSPKYVRRLTRRIRVLGEDYDWVFLDCAPSISLVSEAVFTVADALIVPTIPTALSRRTLRQLVRHLRRRPSPVQLLPFYSMVDRRRALHRRTCDAPDEMPCPMLATEIPYSSAVEQMSARREPLCGYSKTSPAARAYASLWSELVRRLESPPPAPS